MHVSVLEIKCKYQNNTDLVCKENKNENCGKELIKKTNSAEECESLCKERNTPPCHHFVWFNPSKGSEEGEKCFLIGAEKDVTKNQDTQVTSGSCPITHGQCVCNFNHNLYW